MHKEIVYIKNRLPELMKASGIGFKEMSEKCHVSEMTLGAIYAQGCDGYKPKKNDYVPSIFVAMLVAYSFDMAVDDFWYPVKYVSD